MELVSAFFDLVLHLDRHLLELARIHGLWVYAVLFAIVFLETGVVAMPFLPGDSLLFVAGTVAASGALEVHSLAALLTVAAIIGDSVNYAVGHYVGPRMFRFEDSRFFKRAYVDRTHAFFDRHGGKTLIIARFIPVIRTYAPFVAGIGAMPYRRFLAFNAIGAVAWVVLLTYAGYFFGNLAVVKDNLTLVIIGIIVLSITPGIIEVWRARCASQTV